MTSILKVKLAFFFNARLRGSNARSNRRAHLIAKSPQRSPPDQSVGPLHSVGSSIVLYCIVLYLFQRILQKQIDAYHGSLPHKYRKKNGEMGRGEWKMKHGKKGNKYLNIEV